MFVAGRCKRCDGTIPEANLTEDLMVDGDIWTCRAFVICEIRDERSSLCQLVSEAA